MDRVINHTTKQHKSMLAPGFSLMEIMIAVAIMAAFAFMAGPRIMNMFGKSKVSATKATMSSLKAAIQEYYQDIGHVPNEKEGGLQALVQRPRGPIGKKWDGPYLEGEEDVPTDGWGYEFEYNAPPKRNKTRFKRFEIVSHGENGEEGGSEPIFIGA